MKNVSYELARAKPGDGSEIAHVHHDAIRITAAPFYAKDVVACWGKHPDEPAIARIENAITRGAEIFMVARLEGRIVGYGSIIPAQHEFRSCYVSPEQGRQGIGSAIVQGLLRNARALQLSHLEMHSSLNAEAFYQKNGFYTKALGVHRFTNGVQMPCAIMRIDLPSGPAAGERIEPS